MNVTEIIKRLKIRYPGKFIVENKIDGVTTEILCEIEPTFEHSDWSLAVAVIDKSEPHYHNELTETYKILKGKLTVFIEEKAHQLEEGDEIEIHAGKTHYAIGNETWIEVRSSPGWKKEDHIII